MRLAVLLCGVLSGVIALGFGWWGQADALLHVAGLADAVRLAVALAIQPIALASIVGGAAILVFPAISRATLLASAVGWLALVAILGGGISVPVSVLIVLSAAGGLLGFLPSLKEPMFQLQRTDTVDDEESEPVPAPRRAPLRSQSSDSIAERAPAPAAWQELARPAPAYQAGPLGEDAPPPAPPAPVYQAGPISAADLQKALEAMRPQPQAAAAPVAPVAPPPAVPGQVPMKPRLRFSRGGAMDAAAPGPPLPQVPIAAREPLPPEQSPEDEAPPEPEALPTLGNVVPPLGGDGGWQVYYPPPDFDLPPPTKPAEIVQRGFTPRIGPDEEDHSQPFVPSQDDLRDEPARPRPSLAKVADGRDMKPPPPRAARRDAAPARRQPSPKRRSKSARRRAAIGIGALAIVIIGAPVLLVLDAQMRGGGAKAVPASIDDSNSAVPVGDISGSDRLPSRPPVRGVLPALTGTSGTAGSSQAADTSVATALPVPEGPPYASPFDYCSALGNVDAPDGSQITGGMPSQIATAALGAAKLAGGDFHWRCMDRAVWTCVAAKRSPACKAMPRAVDRSLFCNSHPDVQVTNSPGGDWRCDGFTPVVAEEQLSATDGRGFDRRVWKALSASIASSVGP